MITATWDIETTDLRADIGSLIVASFAFLDDDDNVKFVETANAQTIGKGSSVQREKRLATWTREQMERADILIGHNSLAFDRWFVNGVLFRHNLPLIPKRIHIDTYQTAKGRIGMGASMKNLVDIMQIGSKDAPSKHDWREANHDDPDALARITERCESDVILTAAMWRKLKPIYFERFGR